MGFLNTRVDININTGYLNPNFDMFTSAYNNYMPQYYNLPLCSNLSNWSNLNFSKFGSITQRKSSNSNLGNSIVNTALKYKGYNEKDGSYKLFTGGRSEAWCADFVTYVTKEAFRANGKSVPTGFGSPAVKNLKQWGKDNNCYTTDVSKAKPGDVVIFNKSHTGIVKEVRGGKVYTIEGNTSKGTVDERTHTSKDINGFVQVA